VTTGPSINWDRIQLVVFDVDGTLYNQRPLRLRMFKELLRHSIELRSLETLKVLRIYRRLRDTFGEQEVDGFDEILAACTAKEAGIELTKVRSLVSEWMERRPLPHIRACRYPYLPELFAALKRRKKTIGIFSDYPAVEKLAALDLKADIVVSATDKSVGILKPNPRGLNVIMEMTSVGPQETILIGDRTERDGEAARRAGALSLILSERPIDGWACFRNYSAGQFLQLFEPS
jgi:FMN phosphatase YigB (HAD superfamily)